MADWTVAPPTPPPWHFSRLPTATARCACRTGLQRKKSAPNVLHVITSLERRGAQFFALELLSSINQKYNQPQQVAVLNKGPDSIGIGKSDCQIHYLDGNNIIRKALSLRKIISSLKPDVVFAYGGDPLKQTVLATVGTRRPRIVYRKIGLSESWLGKFSLIKKIYYHWLINSADKISCVGKSMKDELVSLFKINPDKIEVIYRGVSADRFNLPPETRIKKRIELKINPESLVLISVGSLSWEKNLKTTIKAFNALHQSTPNSVLLIAGDGPDIEKLKDLSNSLGINEFTHFLGVRHDVPELMACADILMLTSLTEGIPGVLIEAGLSRLPCIAWNVGGTNEVISNDNKVDCLPPFNDENQFIKSLLSMASKQKPSLELLNQKRNLTINKFSIEICRDKHIQLFESKN
jgi:L-malate glycosyltransferase